VSNAARPILAPSSCAPRRTVARDHTRGPHGPTDRERSAHAEPPPARGQRYTIAVTAPGYEPAIEADALVLPDEGIHRQLPWRDIRLVPRSQ
jgi:hypothetical protein